MERKRHNSEVMLDRFSDLPDQVAQHVLSFLSITDVARVCCVSKRCAERCMSTPALNFDGFSSDWKSTCYKRLQLMTYLERFLFSRGDNKIQSFRVDWERHYVDGNQTPCICDSEHYRMITWIKRAVRCHVEMLDLKMTLYDSKETAFPSCIFLCGSLRSLKVDMDFTLLRTPSFVFSSNLNCLKLRSVVIEDERFFKWISSSCKFLQELHLKELCGTETISIESSSLKRLEFFGVFNVSHLNISGEKLEDISIGWLFESPSNKSFNISAPNLRSLSWMGKLASHTNLGKFKSLQVAILFLEPKADDLQNVYEVFCSLCKVKILMLDEATVKAPFSEGSMPAPIYDIYSLTLNIGSFTDELVPAMASLFKGFPHLRVLYIESKPPPDDPHSNTSGFDTEYWKLQNLAFIHQLKVVTIQLCNGSNGIDLARYILEYARNLLKMVIIYPTHNSEEVTTKLTESKMVSSATVILCEKTG